MSRLTRQIVKISDVLVQVVRLLVFGRCLIELTILVESVALCLESERLLLLLRGGGGGGGHGVGQSGRVAEGQRGRG